MAVGIRWRIEAARVRYALGSLRRQLADLSGTWRQIGARVEQATEPFVPVLSGQLVDSLRLQVGPTGISYGSDLIYAPVQDRGWPGHNIAGHHFMDRAEDELPRAAIAELAPAVQNVIDRLGLR